MKIVVISVLVILFSVTTTFAQFDKNKLFYTMKAEKYKRMKTTGTLLTIAGTALVVISISSISNSTTTTTTNGGYNQNSNSSNGAGAALAFLAGTAGIGAGIPLWIVGAHAQKKYLRKLENASIKFNHNNERSSVSLTYRF